MSEPQRLSIPDRNMFYPGGFRTLIMLSEMSLAEALIEAISSDVDSTLLATLATAIDHSKAVRIDTNEIEDLAISQTRPSGVQDDEPGIRNALDHFEKSVRMAIEKIGMLETHRALIVYQVFDTCASLSGLLSPLVLAYGKRPSIDEKASHLSLLSRLCLQAASS
ncbi:unnamed protein product [Peniophora sp. CBMAI 1063]|nr:unnamed protein product [Peniophora sp. CBMAI 1063]